MSRSTGSPELSKPALRNLCLLHASNLIGAFGESCARPVTIGDGIIHVPVTETPFAHLRKGFDVYLGTTVDMQAAKIRPNSFTLYALLDKTPILGKIVIENTSDETALLDIDGPIKKRGPIKSILGMLESMYEVLAVTEEPKITIPDPPILPLSALDPTFADLVQTFYTQ